jgi:hypothetical protein
MVKDETKQPTEVIAPPIVKPKRKCTQKQLDNLKAGREKSSLYQRLKQKKV